MEWNETTMYKDGMKMNTFDDAMQSTRPYNVSYMSYLSRIYDIIKTGHGAQVLD